MPEPIATVRTMLGSQQVALALRCLGSLKREVHHPVELVLHDDGSLTPEDRGRLAERLAPCVIVDRREAREQVAERLRRRPRCAKFHREHPLGQKLFDLPLLSRGRTVYCDTDILFTCPVRCPGFFLGASPRFVAMRDFDDCYALRLTRWPFLRRHGLRLPSRFNAGMMSFDPAAHDLDYIEWLLDLDAKEGLFGGLLLWIEQTIYAFLAARAGCGYVEPRQCVVAHPTNFHRTRSAAIIHFSGLSRPLLPPPDEPAAGAEPRAPLDLAIVPAPECTLFRRILGGVRSRATLR